MSHRHECMHPCPSCARHVRSTETTCPFCEASLPAPAVVPETPVRGRVASRAALTFFAATAVAACNKTGDMVAAYGPPPIRSEASDAGTSEIAKDGGK